LVNGELKHCLVNLGMHGTGTGLDLSQSIAKSTSIEKNQSANPAGNIKGFFLYTKNVAVPFNNSKHYFTDVQEFSI